MLLFLALLLVLFWIGGFAFHVAGGVIHLLLVLALVAFIFHFFTEDCRRYYGLERLWGDAPNVTAKYANGAGAHSVRASRNVRRKKTS